MAFSHLRERQWFFGARAKLLYELIGWVFRNDTDLLFMNYGYSEAALDRGLSLAASEEAERYSAQLYHAVALQAPISGRRVLDVGSGRGGGAAHLHRRFRPRETVGCDVTHQAVSFCARVHGGIEGLSFVQGDAAALPFAEAEFDVLTNVESAHCYPDLKAFFREGHRVLRPGGIFLFADFTPPRRDPAEVRDELAADLAGAGFGGIEITDVTGRILAGLDADDARRQREIRARFPLGTRWFARLWAGTQGSWIYRDFAEGRRAYLMIRAQAQPLRPLPVALTLDQEAPTPARARIVA